MRAARQSRFALSLCAMLLASPTASADEQLVYWPLVTDNSEYRRVAYPKEAGAVLVLAGTTVILEAIRAPVAYWPITREYLADLSRKTEPVQGQVEIVDTSGRVTTLRPEPYLVWYPEGVTADSAEVIHGDRVPAFYEDYVGKARSAAASTLEYQRVVAEHNAAVEAWLKIAAQRPPTLPPPPPQLTLREPEPYRAFTAEPASGAVLRLAEGTYTIRIRGADRQVVPGSERMIISFAPTDAGIGYVVRPRDRWTQPVVSFGPRDTIYTTGRTDLFIQPVPVAEYEAQRFARLLRPQSFEVADDSLKIWVPTKAADGDITKASLAIENGGSTRLLPMMPYRITQIAGTSRGYTVEEFANEVGSPLRPDFYAMRIKRDLEASVIELREGEKQHSTPASARSIVRVDPAPAPWLFTAALLPLAFGVALRIAARRAGSIGAAWRYRWTRATGNSGV
jgi:hypothetical protein